MKKRSNFLVPTRISCFFSNESVEIDFQQRSEIVTSHFFLLTSFERIFMKSNHVLAFLGAVAVSSVANAGEVPNIEGTYNVKEVWCGDQILDGENTQINFKTAEGEVIAHSENNESTIPFKYESHKNILFINHVSTPANTTPEPAPAPAPADEGNFLDKFTRKLTKATDPIANKIQEKIGNETKTANLDNKGTLAKYLTGQGEDPHLAHTVSVDGNTVEIQSVHTEFLCKLRTR